MQTPLVQGLAGKLERFGALFAQSVHLAPIARRSKYNAGYLHGEWIEVTTP
jgi:hypothetical protein